MFPFLQDLNGTLLGQILLIVGGILVLWAGAEGMVKGASQTALRFGMRPMLVGATVVAFGTSAPEWLVSMIATAEGSTGMAVGNIIGSNVANLTIVLGVTTLILSLAVKPATLRRELPYVLVAELVFMFLIYDGELSFTDGIWLSVVFV
ncbi:MAG: hypothetical protein GY773_15460, partial [Actinomycetia bacterium]|nr:hypothetical protein [Actinomycetes bacterium]